MKDHEKKIRCNICLIFNEKFTKVILIKRIKDPFKGKLNGIGGKLNYRESSLKGMLREIKEELGVAMKKEHLKKFCVVDDGLYIMDVYLCKINEEFLKLPLDTKEGLIDWYEIKDVCSNDECLAGNGFLMYIFHNIEEKWNGVNNK